MPSVVGEITKGAAFDAIVMATNVGMVSNARVLGNISGANKPASELTGSQLRTIIPTQPGHFIYIESPAATDSFPLVYVPQAATLKRIIGVTDVGTVDFNIEKRGQLTPDVAGTDVEAVDLQATAAGLNDTSFTSPAISAGTWLHYSASAIASSPTKVWIGVEYTID